MLSLNTILITVIISTTFLFSNSAHAFTVVIPGVFGYTAEKVVVHISPNNCPSTIRSDTNAAIDLWNSVPTSGLELELGADSSTPVSSLNSYSFTDTQIVIGCSTNFNVDSGGCDAACLDGVLAVGSTRATGENLVQGRIVVNVNAGAGGSYTTKNETTRQITIAHELGHALGLGHTELQPSLMYFNLSSKAELSLAQDDIDGIQYLYNRNEIADQLPLGCGSFTPIPGSGKFIAWWLLLLVPCFLLVRIKLKLNSFGVV